jgi:uncharacterized membrane protein YcaP (DUF421 family)
MLRSRQPDRRSLIEFERIFIGDAPLAFALEIALRTTVMYLYTLVLVRLLGKRGMAQLSPFEMVIIVALGSAVGDPMFYADVPLIHGMLVVTVVVALERLIVRLTEHNQWLERVVESAPVLLVADGDIMYQALEDEDLSEAELFMALRENGVENLGEVRLAFLEPSGKVTVFRGEGASAGRSVLPAT